MPRGNPYRYWRLALCWVGVAVAVSSPAKMEAQRPAQSPASAAEQPMTVNVSVRDFRGRPLDSAAMVHMYSRVGSYDVRNPTREASIAVFENVLPGSYNVVVTCLGYQEASEHIEVEGFGGNFNAYVYLQPEGGAPAGANTPPSGVVLSPKLQSELEKGLELVRKGQYESAEKHLVKATQLAPSNTDAAYLLGMAKLGLKQNDAARQQFEAVLRLDPTHAQALQALGELQLRMGDVSGAIQNLEKAFVAHGADWRAHLLMAVAYTQAGQLANAEKHAEGAVSLANGRSAYALFLLGEVRRERGSDSGARSAWEELIRQFPEDSWTKKAKEEIGRLERPAKAKAADPAGTLEELPLSAGTVVALPVMPVRPWAPPDVDSTEYLVAEGAPCDLENVLRRAAKRLNGQLANLEKFTATERIEHQEINRYGEPGPVRSREFAYIVLVRPLRGGEYFLEERRDGSTDLSSFPTSLATTGILGLGVSVLRATSSSDLTFRCEGLTNVRGAGTIYDLPIKGRVWLSAATFDLLRIETDLREAIPNLELTRDHLVVNYGPVEFRKGKTTLWLPWNAEMFMELKGHRYHHTHSLSDYLLFEVDTTHKVGAVAGE